ncbi:hypothetical protein llap_20673 [Limosa lapponica baueri]|uniref:Fanconi Anaemia group E protein C-terminal domain-containing protein n=1 Tax=Limosa lapponica baueri TaxID=1758121 RepID=A0A2I0T5F1_LIMLA|nr:hypothetical protein llap_20673 [Limosa lapponica baueri]
MAALTSFCSKYPQPFCRVLVAAVLREPGEGAEQIKLVCELVEECLEPDCVRLVLRQRSHFDRLFLAAACRMQLALPAHLENFKSQPEQCKEVDVA